MNATVNLPLPHSVIASVCKARTQALEQMQTAAAALTAAFAESERAAQVAKAATHGARYYGTRADDQMAGQLFCGGFDADRSLAAYRRQLDRDVWTHLMDACGLRQLMDRQARDELEKSLESDVAEATEENVRATLEHLFGQAGMIFRRGLVNAFCKLDRRFKSHDGFKIGSRVIFQYAFDRFGFRNHGGTWATIADVERVLAVLDRQPPDISGLEKAVDDSRRGGGLDPRQSKTEARYFRLDAFKNGNAHLWFTRDDLVEKANLILADHYGAVLPDAYADPSPDSGLFRSTEVAKDLQFYRSPQPVVQALLKGLALAGKWVLEPSAGDGAIALPAAAAGANVRAIEVNEDRCDLLRAKGVRQRGGPLSVERANFLRVPSAPSFDLVLMNPPFYGTHWMDHVRHAFDFLKPGGILRAVLPASAEVNETPKHEAFRTWAKPFGDYGWRGPFEDLPAESFAESGTRINTVILHLRKR